MATYRVKKEITITRHEGDLADLVFTVPPQLNMTGYGLRLWVKDVNNRIFMKKDTADFSATVNAQLVSIVLFPADTKGKAGKCYWESEIYNENGPITIGYGPFIITPEMIK